MTRDEFHCWLRYWVQLRIAEVDGDEDRLDISQRIDGDYGTNGHNRKLLVTSPSGKQYVLQGATTLAGITEYLFRLQANPDLTWDVQKTPSGWRVNPGGEYLDGFEFYELSERG